MYVWGGCSRAPGNNTMYYYRLHGCIFGGCKMYCYGLHPTLGVVVLAVVICINTSCKCIFTGCKLYYYRLHWCFCVDACNFQEKEQERERERERESFLYGSYCSGWHPTIRFVVQAVAECMGHELPTKVPVPHWPPTSPVCFVEASGDGVVYRAHTGKIKELPTVAHRAREVASMRGHMGEVR